MSGYGVFPLVIILSGGVLTAYLWWIGIKRYWLLMLITTFAAIISCLPPVLILTILPIAFVTLVPILVGGFIAYIGSRDQDYGRIIIFMMASAVIGIIFLLVLRRQASEHLWFLAILNSGLFVIWLSAGFVEQSLAISKETVQLDKLKLYATWSLFFVALVAVLERIY